MRSFFVSIMILSLAAPVLVKNYVLISFYSNRERIAKEWCIEKDNPSSCCKGSCVLNRQLKDIGEEKKNSQLPFKDETRIVFLVQSYTEFSFLPSAESPLSSWYHEPLSEFSPIVLIEPPAC